jgi:hypothetical protein
MNPRKGDKPNLGKNNYSEGYQQVYVIKHKRNGLQNNFRDVFFQCGNWCYDGIIPFQFLEGSSSMQLCDIPKVAPALQKQQQDLSFVCTSSE